MDLPLKLAYFIMNTTTTSVSFKPCVWEVHNGFDFYSCNRGYTLCTNPEWLFEDAKKTREKVNAYYGYNAYPDTLDIQR
jgi:hypothetical protein